MGLFQFFTRKTASEKALSASQSVVEAIQDRRVTPYPPLGGINTQPIRSAWQRGIEGQYGWIYRTQPAVREVIDYIARNVAQLPLKCYERVDDNERRRDESHPAAMLMADPDGRTPTDALIHRLVSDYLTYDNALLLKLQPEGGRRSLLWIPAHMVTVDGGRFTPDAYYIWRTDGTALRVDPNFIVHWYGYNPEDPLWGLSKLETLRQELATDRAIQAALTELAKSGLKGGYIERSIDAPEASQEDLQRIAEQWKAGKVKGDPILDEGMKYVQTGVTPKDADIIPSRQFTREEVWAAYGMKYVPPTTDEERKQFYSDVLPPITKSLACKLNIDVLRKEFVASDHYFEFDLNEKLRGDIENRFAAITASTGAPWLTRNEARAMENKPPVDGGDELITPLNVQVGSNPKPAPNVMGPQDPNKPPQDGSYREQPQNRSLNGNGKATPLIPRRAEADARRDGWANEYEGVLRRHFDRQGKSVKSAQGQKAVTDERWNNELASDLRDVSRRHFSDEGKRAGFRLATLFDASEGQNWLAAKAESAAEAINAKTQEHIEKDGAETAFAIAKEKRATDAGMGYATDISAMAVKVATEQAPGKRMVTIDGGDCDICGQYQGAWPADEVPAWPSYHPHCDCVADPS